MWIITSENIEVFYETRQRIENEVEIDRTLNFRSRIVFFDNRRNNKLQFSKDSAAWYLIHQYPRRIALNPFLGASLYFIKATHPQNTLP
jgi:hypothetical protein